MRAPTGDGLQATRTALSWRRTIASACAASALVIHHALVGAGNAQFTAPVLTTACAAALTLATVAVIRIRSLGAHPACAGFSIMRLCSAAVALTAAGALWPLVDVR